MPKSFLVVIIYALAFLIGWWVGGIIFGVP